MILPTREAILADADERIAKCMREIERHRGYPSGGQTIARLKAELHRRTWRKRRPGVVIEPLGHQAARTYCRRCRCHTTAHVTQTVDSTHAGCVYCGHSLGAQLEMERRAAQSSAGWCGSAVRP